MFLRSLTVYSLTAKLVSLSDFCSLSLSELGHFIALLNTIRSSVTKQSPLMTDLVEVLGDVR